MQKDFSAPARGSAWVPGSCGELVQGWDPEWDEPVLVSCPIDRGSRVWVEVQGCGVHVPDIRPKTGQAVRLTLNYLGRPELGIRVQVENPLPQGRGMASSTADVTAAVFATAAALGELLKGAEVGRLACQVEPSDSVFLPGLSCFTYRSGNRIRLLGSPPPLEMLVLDPGGAVDTVAFNARMDFRSLRQIVSTTGEALALLQEGVQQADGKLIAQGATLSARSFQSVSLNPLLEMAECCARQSDALGIVRAHSGTVLGLLYPPDRSDLTQLARTLAVQTGCGVYLQKLIGGGVHVKRE